MLERIAAIAQRTPSAGFSQGQRLVIVTDPAMRKRIAVLYHEDEMTRGGLGYLDQYVRRDLHPLCQ